MRLLFPPSTAHAHHENVTSYILYVCGSITSLPHTSICHISKCLAQHPIGEHNALRQWAVTGEHENEIDDLMIVMGVAYGVAFVCFGDSGVHIV